MKVWWHDDGTGVPLWWRIMWPAFWLIEAIELEVNGVVEDIRWWWRCRDWTDETGFVPGPLFEEALALARRQAEESAQAPGFV